MVKRAKKNDSRKNRSKNETRNGSPRLNNKETTKYAKSNNGNKSKNTFEKNEISLKDDEVWAEADNKIESVLNEVAEFVDIKKASEQLEPTVKPLLKSLFDLGNLTKLSKKQYSKKGLKELVVKDFNTDQIWEELVIDNEPFVKNIHSEIDKFKKQILGYSDFSEKKSNRAKEEEVDEDDDDDDDDDDDKEEEKDNDDDDDDDNDDDEDEEEEEEEEKNPKEVENQESSRNIEKEELFFDVQEMNKFADEDFDEEDENEGKKREESEDSDEDEDMDLDDEDIKNIKYDEFFDPPPKNRKVESDDEDEDEGMEGDAEEQLPSSNYENIKSGMKEKISEMEKKLVSQRDWDQIGEATASQRPADSLLSKHLEFEYLGSLPEPVTQETTDNIEDMIKKRILEEDFDDVIRKIDDDISHIKKQHETVEVSSEKSKMGLAEIYEKEYVEKAIATVGGQSTVDAETERKHKHIATLFGKLCFKLDTLSNFHFTPKPIIEDIEIKTDVAAINMEEVIPMGVSDNQTIAPEEVYKASNKGGIVVDREEMDQKERKAFRRRKKSKFKKKQQEREEKKKIHMHNKKNVSNMYVI